MDSLDDATDAALKLERFGTNGFVWRIQRRLLKGDSVTLMTRSGRVASQYVEHLIRLGRMRKAPGHRFKLVLNHDRSRPLRSEQIVFEALHQGSIGSMIWHPAWLFVDLSGIPLTRSDFTDVKRVQSHMDDPRGHTFFGAMLDHRQWDAMWKAVLPDQDIF